MFGFLALLSAYVLSQFYRAFLAVIAADLSRDLALDPAALASLPAAWLLAFALAQIPIGLALDRFGPRRTMSLSMLFAVAGAAWLGFAHGYAEALAAEALIGLGCSSILMGGLYFIGRTVPIARFALVSSLLVGLGALGDPLSGVPLAWVAGALGWRGALLAMAGVTACVVALVGVAVRDPPQLSVYRGPRSLLQGLGEVLSTRAMWPIVPLTFVSYAVVISTRGLWIAPYLAEVQHLDAGVRSQIATAMGSAMAAGALVYPVLSRAVGGLKRAVIAGTVVAASCCLGLAALSPDTGRVATTLLLSFGGFGLTYALLMAHVRSFLPARLLGAGAAVMNLFFMGGSALVQWSSGQLVASLTAAGQAPPEVFSRLFVAFGAALAVAVAIYVAAPAERREAA